LLAKVEVQKQLRVPVRPKRPGVPDRRSGRRLDKDDIRTEIRKQA
jgi:hypothetical protein